MTVECPRDGRPIHDQAYVCQQCGDYLERSLGDVTALADAVATAYVKGIRSDGRTGRPEVDTEDHLPLTAKVQPLPYDEGVSVALRELHAVLVSWVRLVCEERGLEATCRNTASGLSGWLLGQVTWLRHHPASEEAVDEIVRVVGRLRASLDVAPVEVYAGPCNAEIDDHGECGADLYARTGAATATCRTCGAEYDVLERREWLLAAAVEHNATVPETARALSAFGQLVSAKQIHKWRERGRLLDRGVSLHGQPLVKIGDVIELLGVDQRRAG